MQNRTTILLLLACVFAAISAVGTTRQATVCAARYGGDSDDFLSFNSGSDESCPVKSARTPLEQVLLVLAVGCAGAGLISAGKVWKDRQQDRALLLGARFVLGRQHYR
jgi:hypothetical protein